MLGNGLSWALMITINIELKSRGRYILEEKIKVQEKLLDFLEDIPICTGLGVRRDVTNVEFFYTLFSGHKIKLNGFVDDEEEYDLEYPGINYPKPEAKKIVPEKRKKKGKKGKNRENTPVQTLTYDEMIEYKESHDTDDEYGFECHFSEQLF